MALLFSRLGITYTGRSKKKDSRVRRTPMDSLGDDEE